MKYEQQATKPDWYESDDSKVYASATMGASRYNEWYEWDSRADAIAFIGDTFCSQTFFDNFLWFEDEFYDIESFTVSSILLFEDGAIDQDELVLRSVAVPASLNEMVRAESRF